VTLVWTVPVVAAAAATVVVVARARQLEDEARALAVAVDRLSELRPRLAAVRAEAAETELLVSGFRNRHPIDPPSSSGPGSRTEATDP
jgi:hypothetical protein